jgi:DNA-binding MarR family transcriptional regulator
MTMSEALAGLDAADAVVPGVPVRQVADNFVALMRSFGRAKARFVAAAEHDVEWSSQIILRHLATNGPMRASALADCLQSDPSTVSRQVAALVKEGLLERRAEPEDGRASILVLTPLADEVIERHEQARLDHFAAMLADWNERDLRRFADLLARFTVDFETASSTIRTTTPEQTASRHVSAEGKN